MSEASGLGGLTAGSFAPWVGEVFGMVVDESMRLEVELVSVTPSGEEREGVRTPFTVVFRGPTEPLLPQRMYRFEHGEMGVLEIFVVPIARDEQGVLYEAVFN